MEPLEDDSNNCTALDTLVENELIDQETEHREENILPLPNPSIGFLADLSTASVALSWSKMPSK